MYWEENFRSEVQESSTCFRFPFSEISFFVALVAEPNQVEKEQVLVYIEFRTSRYTVINLARSA